MYDAALIVGSFAFGSWLFLATNSLSLAAWGFLLGQSLFVLAPRFTQSAAEVCTRKAQSVESKFERAAKIADTALGQVIRGQ